MAISQQLQDRIEALAADLRKELYGPKGYPPWGTKFVEIEEQTGEVGDALACAMLSQSLREQAEVEGHTAGKCSGCGEPIPLEEIAGRLLQAKRGEAAWQESFGRCKRCRKAFFPSLQGFGNRSR
jgi:hypothetical protein